MAIRAFISYSHKDADLLDQLHEHLSALKRQNLIDAWTDRQIHAGGAIDESVETALEQAELYLLMVSSAFIQSDYCFQKEFARACERQQAGKAIIVPIIVRECDWKIPELRRFKALPDDGKPVISRYWHNADEAFANVTAGLRRLIERGPFAKSKPTKPSKSTSEKFIPDERHVTAEQREELRALVEQIVERLIARAAHESDESVQAKKGRWFGIVWSQFNKKFNITEHGLPSLLREDFQKAKNWLRQYRASKNKNFKRTNPQKYRNTLTTAIHTIKGKLGWSDAELYRFASEKVGYPNAITSLNDLGVSQLELVKDRIRYEKTKQIVQAGQVRARVSRSARGTNGVDGSPSDQRGGFQTLVQEIRRALDHGTEELENVTCRAEVNALIRSAGLHHSPEDMDNRTLMQELAKSVLAVWPDDLNLRAFEPIEQRLLPLRRIRAALKPEVTNQWAVLVEEPRITDPRLPLRDFKIKLWTAVTKR